MNVITRTELRYLSELNGEYVVSIYMPEYAGAERRQNPVRFRNLLRVAGHQMLEMKIGRPAIQKMSVTARELLDRNEFWKEPAAGLAVFVTGNGARAIKLPFACEESCEVAKHANLLPLLAWVTRDAPYYVLAVSQNSVRMLQGTRAAVEEVAVPHLPSNLAEALNYDTRQDMMQAHTGRPQLGGKEGLVFHGQGGEVDVAKDELTAYFRVIDRAVSEFLGQSSEPLIFVGVHYLFPIYQAVNGYPHLASTPVAGNPELLTMPEICAQAWPLVEAAIRSRSEIEIKKYWDLVSHGRATNRLEDVLAAATAGSIETLFVAPDANVPGRFDPDTGTVRCDATPQPDSENLANLAATLALQTGASLEAVESGNIPGGGILAAVTRYKFTPAAVASFHQHKDSTAGAAH